MKVKRDSSSDDPYRALANLAATETPGGYRALAQEAGVGGNPDSGRVILTNWVIGRKDKRSRAYKPPLSARNRKSLLAYFERRYPAECERIRRAESRALLTGLAKTLPVRPSESPQQVFAKALAEEGLTEIDPTEIRAGCEIQRVYAPVGGLTVEDLEFFGPLLGDDDREELARAVELNLRAREAIRSRQGSSR